MIEYQILDSGDVAGRLIGLGDEILFSHCSSSLDWLKGDLTINFSRRRTELERRYPEGYEVILREVTL